MINEFCNIFPFDKKNKEEQAEAFIWFHFKMTGEQEITLKKINEYFKEAYLPDINVTRIKQSFAKSKRIYRGSMAGTYRLTRHVIDEYDSDYGYIFNKEPNIEEKANLYKAPFLSKTNIDEAKKMAELYVILHCYENSARKLIEKVLLKKLGEDWWENAANANLKNKFKSRKDAEEKNKWLTPRGASPLFYIDWGDLLNIIRKYEPDFLPCIKDMKFIELRFEELERIRNIVAHSGFLSSDEDFQRVILSFNDWCKQVNDY